MSFQCAWCLQGTSEPLVKDGERVIGACCLDALFHKLEDARVQRTNEHYERQRPWPWEGKERRVKP
jgi:hypothetical protein